MPYILVDLLSIYQKNEAPYPVYMICNPAFLLESPNKERREIDYVFWDNVAEPLYASCMIKKNAKLKTCVVGIIISFRRVNECLMEKCHVNYNLA